MAAKGTPGTTLPDTDRWVIGYYHINDPDLDNGPVTMRYKFKHWFDRCGAGVVPPLIWFEAPKTSEPPALRFCECGRKIEATEWE